MMLLEYDVTLEHHSNNWFNNVSLEDSRDEDTTLVGQLTVLFKCPVSDNNIVSN